MTTISSPVPEANPPLSSHAVVRRIVAHAIFKLESAAHFGGGERGEVDLTLARGADATLMIPGSSIAGASRSYLAYRLLGADGFYYLQAGRKDLTRSREIANKEVDLRGLEKKAENRALLRLFGAIKDEGDQSALICYDAYAIKPNNETTTIRDGVAINPETGQSLDTARYDYEVVERNTKFGLRFEVVIRQELATNSQALDNTLELFNELLAGFEKGEIRLGARTRRGLGRGKIEGKWQVQDFNFTDFDNYLTYLNTPGGAFEDLLQPTFSVVPDRVNLKTQTTLADKRAYFELKATFNLTSSLLIRKYIDQSGKPDVAQLLSDGEPVLPGTGVAGVLRHRATQIVNTLAGDDDGYQQNAVQLIEGLFGKVELRRQGEIRNWANDPVYKQFAGRLRVEENLLEGAWAGNEAEIQTRNRIDPFTGGTLAKYLFNEQPAWSKPKTEGTRATQWQLNCRIFEPTEAEIGLLLFLLKDLWLRDLAIGGGSAIGRGIFDGVEANLTLVTAQNQAGGGGEWEFKSDPPGQPNLLFSKGADMLKKLNGFGDALQKAIERKSKAASKVEAAEEEETARKEGTENGN